MEEVTLKEILNVVLDVKQELKQEMQDMKSELREEMQDMKSELKEEMQDMKSELKEEMQVMNNRISALEKTQKEMIREQVDTREIVKIIVDKIGEIDRKLDAQAKDKCIFHKTLVGANHQ